MLEFSGLCILIIFMRLYTLGTPNITFLAHILFSLQNNGNIAKKIAKYSKLLLKNYFVLNLMRDLISAFLCITDYIKY